MKLEQMLDELADLIKCIREKINQITDEYKETIDCPIMFEGKKGGGQELGLPYGKNQVVWYDDEVDYKVGRNLPGDNVYPKIQKTPIRREDFTPKIGHWYFVADNENPNFTEKYLYKCFIGNKKYFYVSCNENVIVAGSDWEYYYPIITGAEE